MQWTQGTPKFDFMRFRRVAMVGSTLINVVAILSIALAGFNYGIDFTGGIIVEAGFSSSPNLDTLRADLGSAGFSSAQVQNFGSTTDVLIRLPPAEDPANVTSLQDEVRDVLRKQGDAEILRFESIGPQVGQDLAEQGALAMVVALAMVFVYVMLRFRWKFAVGAIVATLHDVLVAAGIFAIVRWQFDLTVLGALLAVLGYSLNDTIVLYDRIRDNFRLMRRGTAVDIVNTSVNQTLSRTIVTGLTTLLVVVALALLGGDALWGFSVTLIIGILVGTYSSIYVASAMAVALNVSPADLVVAKQERVDELP
jgi:preprotein translocase subunit SecF